MTRERTHVQIADEQSAISHFNTEVKVHLDVSSRNNGFAQRRVVEKASSSKLSSKSMKRRIDVTSFQPSKDETKSNSKHVKSCYKLEMNKRGTSLSFRWALKSRNKVQDTLGIKQARPKLLSRSVKNDPRRSRGGPKLKSITDPSEVSVDTPNAEPIGQVNEEDEWQKSHATNEAFDSERKSRQNSSQFRGLYCSEKKDAILSRASSDSKYEEGRDLSNMTPVKRRKQETAKVTKEKFATNNDAKKRRRSGSGQPLKETTITQARSLPVTVVVCNNERDETPLLPEPVRDLQETQSQSKTKIEHQSTSLPEIEYFLPAAMETMKAEGLPSPNNGPNEMSKKGFGVTREDLLKAVGEQGLRMRAVDLEARFRHQLDTKEAQEALLHLLKENFKPEKMNGEWFVLYNGE
ncbi:hypothetical protein MPTK1_3g05630 [Marchantia polymorpha subsp. ruderalis]|uniref:Uncharacterized protein n=2 Tax=Marchantia polymorpha TaxID=3197 RepID=A0AAF6AXR8_MARPO|nr:hypothetical protein MARPO_0006s0035 [Marchantia polymorpha]BBN04552.1 hypothetical protein Mp_3g05630 [Marchantia polymorpha subsp. ruderalis]|eukprot:PTQ47990.1 hypothetical protein MARPO_0006s0035 [Marchantia polymorpha]